MDFSNFAFRSITSPSKVSDDTMSHTNMVMACRFGWSSTPDLDVSTTTSMQSFQSAASASPTTATSTFNNVRTKRFAPCQGRLYHQLLCSHRIRTDLVEDCGANCVEPFGSIIEMAFVCNECIQVEASKIWEDRKAEHNAQYPPMERMTTELYDKWYAEHRRLEADFAREHEIYVMNLKAKMLPSNICSAVETSKEEMEFATELDSLSLSLMNSNTSLVDPYHPQTQAQTRTRTSLPNDASEQLHWNLNSLALDRGACGVEYSVASRRNIGVPATQHVGAKDSWQTPRRQD